MLDVEPRLIELNEKLYLMLSIPLTGRRLDPTPEKRLGTVVNATPLLLQSIQLKNSRMVERGRPQALRERKPMEPKAGKASS